ncbi:MAG: dihydroxyacetone kinase family protein [Tropicimonas sp.]|uniref:dihydroxyacetone kinase family protein n=1 Tax=Tropicimonas sp. TaxID=2067044 RepID=UPI003A85FCFA
MKKFINSSANAVREALEGMAATDATVMLHQTENVLLRADIPAAPADRPVAVISGGGAGHEPAHAGYVGAGMLSAAVSGDIFTSPSVDAVVAGIRAAAGPAGALLIVKNYTGDRLNFSLAAELARSEGIPTEVLLVRDDVALLEMMEQEQARGIAGTVLVHKAAGAAALRGDGLAQVAQIARSVAGDVVSMGVALDGCTIPGAERSGFELGPSEIEFGLGIHGEKGAQRGAMQPADAITDEVVARVLARVRDAQAPLGLLVNGLGATSPMELAIIARRAMQVLARSGRHVALAWTGNFMTALDMPGVSISLLPLDDARIALLTAPTAVRAWPCAAEAAGAPAIFSAGSKPPAAEVANLAPIPALKAAVIAVSDALSAAEPELTRLDMETGDGDLGASMLRAAEALRDLPDGACSSPARLMSQAGLALRRAIGGSSGPFYAAGLLRASQHLENRQAASPADWIEALGAACAAISEMGGARPGDRTMLDALHGGWQAGQGESSTAQMATKAAAGAREAAGQTADMPAKFGRAAYLGERVLGHPDAGAIAVAIWFEAIAASVAGPT